MPDNTDFGWQKTLWGMKKFHYFVAEFPNKGSSSRFQRALCGKWLFDTKNEEEDTRPPYYNGEECVACIRKYEATYGKPEGGDVDAED